jgi:hypothetical protein
MPPLKHFSIIHFRPQLFKGIGGGTIVIPPDPPANYRQELQTLGLGLELGLLTYYLRYGSPPP